MKKFVENYCRVLSLLLMLVVLTVYPVIGAVIALVQCFTVGTYMMGRILLATVLICVALTDVIAIFAKKDP